ncbi:rapid alkalinization factor-like [Punica granatum]|uniref:Rapid alkalinization factor-like n=2 Tax=Punica granatum TaxID=22663 RepID=A0A6P8DYJ6_PUNGR|nr:rapid alkalinization factor-like [Punica granatum]XP_031402627.1 rapid alkalinization factor-like [Punica granatum]PKI37183.1 hypothetical protein CRG98_042429 [Punica granatum]
MATFSSFLVSLVLLLLTALTISISDAGNAPFAGRWVPTTKGQNASSVEECLAENEFGIMDSKISRRILATSQFISYQALRSNSVPCSRRGASYYNCRPGAEANPYIHACTTLSQCRS